MRYKRGLGTIFRYQFQFRFHILNKDLTLLQCHNISCFCVTFIVRIADGNCENELHVPSWTLKRFKPSYSLEVKNNMLDLDEEIESGTNGEWIYDVCVGDNVVVIVNNDNDEQLWLLLVDKIVHIIQASFEDGWGNPYVKGNVVLRGYWYARQRAGNFTYVLQDDKPHAYVFSHLIMALKF